MAVQRQGQGPALVLLHGFTGSGRTFDPFVAAWEQRYTVLRFDALGHGQSPAPPDPAAYRLQAAARDIARRLNALGFARAHVLGYSMGGRLALTFALAYPERVDRLVLESASAGLEDPVVRAARRASDHELARRIERDGIEAFVDWWEALELFRSQARLEPAVRAALRAQRRAQRARGLAMSLRGAGVAQSEPQWEALAGFGRPTLLVAGALDPRYAESARAMARRLPRASVAVVAGAGHAVHLERPGEFSRVVTAFLAEATDQPDPDKPGEIRQERTGGQDGTKVGPDGRVP